MAIVAGAQTVSWTLRVEFTASTIRKKKGLPGGKLYVAEFVSNDQNSREFTQFMKLLTKHGYKIKRTYFTFDETV